jgi:predicted MPP superfamily phosphohydrolase
MIGIPAGLLALGAAGVAYGAGIERRSPRLRRVEVPVLSAGSSPLRLLHISDAHLIPRQSWKREWIAGLAALEPDLVINTGDNIAALDAVPPFLDSIDDLLKRPGAFVFGSNDFFAPVLKNPVRYLVPSDRSRPHGPELPWRELREGMTDLGWLDLDNARGTLKVDGRTIALVGVGDPHIGRDRYDDVSGGADPGADLVLGVTHSPEPRVLSQMAADGAQLILAGHTHGGQLRIPYFGPIITNCGLDRARARGLSRFDGSWLHVSAGLGTSPFAPMRFSCPPEATLLTLVAAG